MISIKIQKLDVVAKTPTRGSSDAAGYDLYAGTTKEIDIAPHSTAKIPTNIAMEIPNGYFGAIYARSGLATKKGLRPANCVGVIDSDYRGNIIVAIHNDTDEMMTIEPMERVAQIIIQPYLEVEFIEVETLNDTDRGANGFGSTGTN
jgi:dUTP pyrophosphatase